MTDEQTLATVESGRPSEVFVAFLKLGLTSFGGPIAHLGYFREELVVRRRWLSEAAYADLVALCQFLPGPASSQVGFALGYLRGGLRGALLAWAAFTLPSALLLLAFALGADAVGGALGQDLLQGLKLVAVAIVAQAVWGMARNLAPDRERATMALAAVLLITFAPSALGQIAAILVGASAGLRWCRPSSASVSPAQALTVPLPRGIAALLLGLFALLLFGLPLLVAAGAAPGLALFEVFYRAGALVFGGGHVVLPLLEASLVEPGWISADAFLSGYGAAQAVPGPVFTVAAYLGAIAMPDAATMPAAIAMADGTIAIPGASTSPTGAIAVPGASAVLGAAIALLGIFLPGMLLLMGVLPFWGRLRQHQGARAAMAGANAAVVGILGAALYQPLWTSAVGSGADFAIALSGFVLLTAWKAPPWLVVILSMLAASLLGVFGEAWSEA
ncbi:chromate efflux transporter [Halochromatium glycolicum]|uniref:Chromate transporter n=1 Tax=Halochromatium glycolicum TaxID=85075 RepID=A0AAJ0XA56_9GAMM|nr:chromate efflux transporter [Halochromatium glycolicum]MBK1705484.1 chromate transporter [Halochromatium glycolicum]